MVWRCDDGEEWRPLDLNNATKSKAQEESSDLVIGSDSHEDYTTKIKDSVDNPYQTNGETAILDTNVNEHLKLIPIEKTLHVPSNQMILRSFPVPLPIEMKEPFQLHIPVPVKIEKELLVPVDKIVYHPVVKPVPIKVIKQLLRTKSPPCILELLTLRSSIHSINTRSQLIDLYIPSRKTTSFNTSFVILASFFWNSVSITILNAKIAP
ncbi:unnamed protein product [Nezara viridula]|uniref:Uncharacterized protein n=1 Tax=Nezara viridula TaxID=85310 RepID=A0A9P0E233_NEZVI|nr:unnamed protein product [Nezara viridula]